MNKRFHNLIPLISFSIAFLVTFILYHAWYDPRHVALKANAFELAAVYYFKPLANIFGTVIILYIAELFGVIRIKRSKVISIVLIAIICVLSIWVILDVAYIFTKQDIYLLGKQISHLPEKLLPIDLVYLCGMHLNHYEAMLVYEVLGIGLFAAIGSKHRTDSKINL